ncbi:universal stress protein [Aeromicrobium choanae]|uniref:Universal stress protein n=1 Tax=Aeromicrobium choanae TaxID=1736691 RepID=A0A1T4Z1J2_9ACTN|nr:universal stress protein [Aeromicrobium choanae]SKB07688.1 Nucleotide-binding universal stress protein, UspA family [Aeromicrobium choanae]
MYKTILVGVDGSDTASRAAEVAAELASATGAALHIVTAVDEKAAAATDLPPGMHPLSPGERAEAIARQVAESLSYQGTVEASPAPGKPADALVHVAKEIGADLIVVGNRRVQGISRLLGSVATDVAHHAPCDVYIVKTV